MAASPRWSSHPPGWARLRWSVAPGTTPLVGWYRAMSQGGGRETERHMPTQLGEWAYGAWSPFYGRG
jgi:hypothetical protein